MARRRPEDYNAFGYDPRGRMANAAALLFGEDWRPDQDGLPRYPGPQVAVPRYGPPADYQQPYLPPHFAPQLPHNGYLGALQFQRREGPWAGYPMQQPQQPMQYPPHPPPPVPRRPAEGPNAEVRPGVFRMTAHFSTGRVSKQFSFESDLDYADFRSRACANLELQDALAELGYRVRGAEGPRTLPASLASADEFARAMARICSFIERARSKEYGIEVVNLAPPVPTTSKTSTSKSKKRHRDEDIPPEVEKTDSLVVEYKKLANHTKCESCKGNCHVMRDGTHQKLDFKELTYWTKQNLLGNSTIYQPPEALCFDRRPKRSRPNTTASSAKQEIHVHIDGLQFGGSYQGNHPCVPNPSPPFSTATFMATPPPSSSATPPPPSSSPLPSSSIASSSSSNLLDLQGNPIDDMLVELDRAYSAGTKYRSMASTLHDTGIKTAKDLASRNISDVILWTGLPLDNIAVAHEYALRHVALDHVGGSPPSAGIQEDNVSESEVDSNVVDSSDTDDSGPSV